ncbi:MAG: IS630 family transposase, partial [Dermatophilaceae bacterium]
LERDIRAWVSAWNDNPKPFVWTKTAEQILASLGRLLKRTSGEGH